MINCLIVDDEPIARQIITEYVSLHPDLTLAGVCQNAMEAFSAISTLKPHLVFLDIQMPQLTGTDLIKTLKEPPAFIFVTAYPEYAVDSYDLNATDYLLKPVTYERFCAAISKFRKQQPEAEPPPTYAYFKVDGRMVKVEHSDIIYAQSIKDYLIVYTTKGKYITHMTMKYLAELLPAKTFKRVHRSFVVSVAHITSVSKYEIELGNLKVPVGESYRSEVALIAG